MNRFAKKRLNRNRVYPVTNTVDAYGGEDRFIRTVENTIERGGPVVTAHKERNKMSGAAYPPPSLLMKEINRLCKLRVRHINHCMSEKFEYAFTLTVPPSSALRHDGAELLRSVNEFVLQNPEQKFIIQLEVYPGSPKSKPAYHVHGMSTHPINLRAWAKKTGARKNNLYCEPLINQLQFAKYINKDLHLLPKKLHSIKSNVKRVDSYLYLDADGRIQYTNDPNLSATYKRLVAASASKDDASSSNDIPSANGALMNIVGSMLCLREHDVKENSPLVHTAENSKCHFSSSKIHWNTLINVILCHNPLSPGSKSPPEIRGPPL